MKQFNKEVEMGKTNEFKDDFLKRMFKQSSLDSPSDDFTKLVMNRIQVEAVEKSEADKPVIEPVYWILIVAGLAIAAYMLFQMDLSFIQNLFASIEIKPIEFPQFTLNFINSIQSFISNIKIPTIFIVAVVAVISLITLDKVLKTRFSMNMFVF